MATRISMFLILISFALLAVGCKGTLDANVGDFNQFATQVAGGESGAGGEGEPAEPTPEPTAANVRDLTTNPAGLLVQAWGETYGLPSGAEFTIKATEDQVAIFIDDTLRLEGWGETVRGVTVSIGVGQLRMDFGLVAETGEYGSGSITFHPTLDSRGLALNPGASDFGGLRIPSGLTYALGDAVYAALAGAKDEALIRVRLTQLALDNEVLMVVGMVR